MDKWLICPVSTSDANFNSQNTPCIPAVKIFAFLGLEQIFSFMDGHKVGLNEMKPNIISDEIQRVKNAGFDPFNLSH